MFPKFVVGFSTFSVLCLSQIAAARILWLERDGRAVLLHPRRFGQEHPVVIDKLSAACPGQVCGTLSGQAITPLLAAQGECTQQDMADQIIDASRQFNGTTQTDMIALAQEYRKAEKNTSPDFTTNPPTNRNSVFCQTAPKNAELNGLVQAQDPSNDPNVFFDPATGKSVQKGSQSNTFPFGGSTSNSSAAVPLSSSNTSIPANSSPTGSSMPGSSTPSADGNIGNFGSCSVPEIVFGTGFDNRKETSFEPANKTSYNHGSAQNIDIITQFICDTLTNSCGADQTAKNTCTTAKTAADAAAKGTGAQADAFNDVFGNDTNFTSIASVDDQGNVISGTGSSSSVSPTPSSSSGGSTSTSSANTPAGSGNSSASGTGNFGSCSVPQIEFATGLDGRKETAFAPVDEKSYNHGSADNIDVVSQFICLALTNTCGADQTAKSTCATAITAADAAAKGTGAQADAFNKVFGIVTNFAAVASVDNTGKIVPGTGSNNTSPTSTPAGNGTSTSTGIGNFGSCSVPQIEFGTGFDGRKETSFEPVNKTSYNHGSAQNIDIITQFICDTLTNSCGADQTAKNTCATATTAADGQTTKTGAQADAFNNVFGIKTNFAATPSVDDQGNVISGTGSGSSSAAGNSTR